MLHLNESTEIIYLNKKINKTQVIKAHTHAIVSLRSVMKEALGLLHLQKI